MLAEPKWRVLYSHNAKHRPMYKRHTANEGSAQLFHLLFGRF